MKIDTEAAELERFPDGDIELRFKADVKLTIPRMEEVMRARKKLCGDGPYRVLVTLPEDIDFDVNVLTNDHYKDRDLDQCTCAVAWDAESEMNEELVEIFYRYFPQPFPVKVFRTHSEARKWLRTMHPSAEK